MAVDVEARPCRGLEFFSEIETRVTWHEMMNVLPSRTIEDGRYRDAYRSAGYYLNVKLESSADGVFVDNLYYNMTLNE